jgi:hypothetical protein
LKNSNTFVKETIKHPVVLPKLSDFLGEIAADDNVSDLAD